MNIERFEDLVGKEVSILDLSNDLQKQGCEDIGCFGNMEEIIESGEMVVATKEDGSEHIIIEFDGVWIADTNEESILASIIKIADMRDF